VEASRVKETSNQRRKIWEEDKFPHMWKKAVIVPSFKKKDKLVCDNYRGIKGKESGFIYSAFIVVPHTQGAQVRITQCYLQITPYLPLPRKHSPDGASPD